MKKKILAVLLTLCLLSSAIIPAALAVDDGTAQLDASVACDECGELSGHLETCSQYSPADDAEAADNCPYCEETTAEDGTVTHAAGCNAAYAYDGSADVGRFARPIDDEYGIVVTDTEHLNETPDLLFYYSYYSDFEAGTVFKITDWYWGPSVAALWYKVEFHYGAVVEEYAQYWPDDAWVLYDYTDPNYEFPPSLEFVTVCDVCGGVNCTENHESQDTDTPVSLSKTANDFTVTVSGILPGVTDLLAAAVGAGSVDPEYVGVDLSRIIAAVDITPVDADGAAVQPKAGTTASVTVVYEGLEAYNGQQIEIRHDHNGAVRSLGYVTVADGAVSFETDGFSTYYLVAGSQSDSSGNDTFYIMRGVSVELTNVTNDSYSVTCPDNKTPAECGVTISRSGNTLTFAAGNAALYGTYTVKISGSRTATIIIKSARDMFDMDGITKNVYFTVISDSTEVPKEPMAGGSYTWNYIKKSGSSYTFTSSAWGTAGRYATSPDGFLDLDAIANSPQLTQNLQGQNVIGVIDTVSGVGDIPGADTWPCVELTDEEWHAILKAFVGSKTVTISDGKGGSMRLTADMVDETLPDGSYRYRMFPYVVKLIINGGSGQDGWHIDCAVIDYSTYSVTYDYNLPASAVIDESSKLTVPNIAFYLHGEDNVSVAYMKLGSKNVTGTTGVTIYDPADMSTSEYYFVQWNTKPDGTGTGYDPTDTLPPVTENVTLYAIWRTDKTTGTVRINKAEVFEDAADPRKGQSISYTFTVTIAGAENGDSYPYTVYNADGTIKAGNLSIATGGTVTLCGGEYAIINNVPAGEITVAETVPQDGGFEPAWAVGSGAAAAGAQTSSTLAAGENLVFTCTNTYPAAPKGDLQVTKLVTGVDIPEGDEFLFTADLPDGSYSYTLTRADGSSSDGTLTAAGGSASFSLKKDETIVIEGIPVGSYTVTEAEHNDYITDPASPKTVAVEEDATAQLSFTNTFPRAKGALSVSKTVTSEPGVTIPEGDEFAFTVDLPDGSYSYTLHKADGSTVTGSLTASGGSTSFGLMKDESIVINNVPEGSYTVTEADHPDYITDPAPAKAVAVEENATAEITFQNTYPRPKSSLAISKTVTGEDAPAGDEFTFTVNLPSGSYSYTMGGASGTLSSVNNSASFTLKHGQTITINGVPIGSYTVTEAAKENYTADSASKSVTVAEGSTARVSFVNSYSKPVGALTITKRLGGTTADVPENQIFTFTVTGSNVTLEDGDVYSGYTVNGGKLTVTITGAGSRTISGLPVGTYIVSEQTYSDYDQFVGSAAGTSGVVSVRKGGTATIVFTNNYKRGNLTVTKSVSKAYAADTLPNDSFTFTFNVNTSAAYDYVITEADGSTRTGKISDGQTFRLAAGEEIVIKGIPIKAAYSVTETADNDYTTMVDGAAGYTAQGTMTVDGASHAFTNIYRRHLGTLTVNKVLAGSGARQTDSFIITVTGPEGFEPTTVVITGSGSVTLENVPVGTYTVTEDESWSWRYTSSGSASASVTVDDLDAEATITNTYNDGSWLDSETSAVNVFDEN